MKKILFVDDIRQPKDLQGIIVVARGYEQAICFLDADSYDYISLDHDLGEEKTGYDIAKYIVEHNIPLAGFRVHSSNPVGRFNIVQLLTHYGYKEVR